MANVTIPILSKNKTQIRKGVKLFGIMVFIVSYFYIIVF